MDDTKDWLSDDQVAVKSETEDDLDTSEIKTEPESDSEWIKICFTFCGLQDFDFLVICFPTFATWWHWICTN